MFMDENSFDIDQRALASTSARFPAHRLAHHRPEAPRDLGYLRSPSEFSVHAWDENGHY